MTAVVSRSTRYRQAPLRWHVEQQMGWSCSRDWENSLKQVLALDELRRRIVPGSRTKEVFDRQILTLERFFYHGLPDATPYIPVKVDQAKVRKETNEDDHPESEKVERYSELTALIRHLDDDDDPRSILLATQSGAGKTVAARKAFCD